MDTFDVVVIGGGAAGSAAALSAARLGARVAVVRNGPGAAALARGGWRGAPPDDMRAALARAGLELIECRGGLPDPEGVLGRYELAGASHARASIDAGAEGVVVCGIAGLSSFRPAALAALWADESGAAAGAFDAVTLILDDTPATGWSTVSLAALLEREPERLGAAIGRAAGMRDCRRAIVPAVLGLDEHARVLDAVSDAAGVELGEALGTAPSVPGWRLDVALLRALAEADVRVIAGRVVHADVQDRIVQSVAVEGRTGGVDVAARSYVLATGKYVGGGIAAETEFEERALGCDVALERFARTIDDPGAALMLTDPVRTEHQPVLSVGVRVDVLGRPMTSADEVFLANVFVAGSVRAGVESAALGLGAATHDGWSAGARAAALTSTD